MQVKNKRLRKAVQAYLAKELRGTAIAGRAYDLTEESSRLAYQAEIEKHVRGVLEVLDVSEVRGLVHIPNSRQGSLMWEMFPEGRVFVYGDVDGPK